MEIESMTQKRRGIVVVFVCLVLRLDSPGAFDSNYTCKRIRRTFFRREENNNTSERSFCQMQILQLNTDDILG
jgi:hypothetical protein